jgi:hypothetical protein
MFSSFEVQVHSDEYPTYVPTQSDWDEYHEWLEEQEAPLPTPRKFVTDCDYCGNISLCFETSSRGTCCTRCEEELEIS